MTSKKVKKYGSKIHKCPLCGLTIHGVRPFVEHVESHKLMHSKLIIQQNLEAILLGLSASALWDFIKWAVTNIDVHAAIVVIAKLLGQHIPSGFYSSANVKGAIHIILKDSDKSGELQSKVEKGLHFFSEDELIILNRLFRQWCSCNLDEKHPRV